MFSESFTVPLPVILSPHTYTRRPVLLFHSFSPERTRQSDTSRFNCDITVPRCVNMYVSWLTETAQNQKNREIEKAAKFGLCLLSSGRPAVSSSPAYKRTCRPLSNDYYIMCFSASSALAALCPPLTCCETINHNPEKSESITQKIPTP